ncbi:MAG TPA: prolipoprotein diacylglyceryl transferase family protein [Solirubrobacteraceae bacterium]
MGKGPAILRIGSRGLSPFVRCGIVGFVAACAVALAVCADRGLSLSVEAGLIATAVLVFASVALVTKAITGRETLTYYHHEIAVLAAVALVARALDAPVLGHLDATALGLGAFLACGRIGCTLSSCCHGRRSTRGLRYGPQFARRGLPLYLVDVALVPVQPAESVFAAGLVAVGALAIPRTPGAAFGFYVSAYAVARFGLETLRGDPVRRYARGLSEAQWTSLAVVTAMAALALAGTIPGRFEHLAAAVLLAVWAAVAARRRPHDLLDPRHVREVARALADAPARPGAPVQTTLGLRVSMGETDGIRHYTFSRVGRPLGGDEDRDLALLVAWLDALPDIPQVVGGVGGTVHLLVREDAAGDRPYDERHVVRHASP